jgi:low temperature requirement protein LtrA
VDYVRRGLIVTGTTFADLEASPARLAAFVVAFLGSAAFWWIYFSRHAEAAREAISSFEDPGRLARSAYTYFHLPMVAGIIVVASSDELTVAHPLDPGTPVSIMLVLGGTALFLVGQACFKLALSGVLPWSPWSRTARCPPSR